MEVHWRVNMIVTFTIYFDLPTRWNVSGKRNRHACINAANVIDRFPCSIQTVADEAFKKLNHHNGGPPSHD